MQVLRGLGRKLAIPVLLLPLLGWILYVVGFAAFNNRNNSICCSFGNPNSSGINGHPQRAELAWFPHWCVLIVGPFVFVCSFLHLLIGRWFTGVLTSFLVGLYLVCCGAVIHYWAVKLFDNTYGLVADYSQLKWMPRTEWLVDQQWGLWPLVEWIGALSTALFLTLYMMMWPCFKTKPCNKQEEGVYDEEGQEMVEEGEWDEKEEEEQEGEWEEQEGEGELEGEEQEGEEQEEAAPSAPAPTE